MTVPYTAQGLGVYVSLSTMDKYWYPGIGREEALGVMKKCMAEAQHREFVGSSRGTAFSRSPRGALQLPLTGWGSRGRKLW